MLSSKLTGFLTEVDLSTMQKVLPASRSEVRDEDVIHELQKDYSSYIQANVHRTRAFTRESSKEAQCNSLALQIKRKQEKLKQLQDLLLRLEDEQRSLETVPTDNASAKLHHMTTHSYPPHRQELTFLSLQYDYVLFRTEASNLKAKSLVHSLQKELVSISELLRQGQEEEEAMKLFDEQNESQMTIMQEHLYKLRAKRAFHREELVQRLKKTHSEVDVEWNSAKSDKAQSIVVQKNILWLRAWLSKQREVRKILHLHLGLEEMAKVRIDRLLARILSSLCGSNVSEALSRYANAMARNHSLVQEAEYKLSLVATLERKLAMLMTELSWVNNQLGSGSARDLCVQKDKSEIRNSERLFHMKNAELAFEDSVKRREGYKQTATESLSQLDSILVVLRSLDPLWTGSAPIEVRFLDKSTFSKALLLLEKRLLFMIDVTEQKRRFRGGKSRPGTVETLTKMLKLSPRMQDNHISLENDSLEMSKNVPRFFASQKTTPTNSYPVSPTSLTNPVSFVPKNQGKSLLKMKTLADLKAFKRAAKREISEGFWTTRMRLFKDFMDMKKVSGSLHREIPVQKTTELTYKLMQDERKLATLTQGGARNKEKKEEKTGKRSSEKVRKQTILIVSPRSYLSTRSETISSWSKSSMRLR